MTDLKLINYDSRPIVERDCSESGVFFFLLVGFQLLGAISQLIYENCLFIQEIGWHLNIRKVTLFFF